MFRMILTDLDDTLLRRDKTVSSRTMRVLERCRRAGMLLAFCTARASHGVAPLEKLLTPDAVISSCGALVRLRDEIVHSTEFTREQCAALFAVGRQLGCRMTADAVSGLYRNYGADEADIGSVPFVCTDFEAFDDRVLKICLELPDDGEARRIAAMVPGCDCLRFVNSRWYKLTPAGATKERAVEALCGRLGLRTSEIIAFGDDVGDAGMLRLSGRGVAVANAVPEVLRIADDTTADCDADGVAAYLETLL